MIKQILLTLLVIFSCASCANNTQKVNKQNNESLQEKPQKNTQEYKIIGVALPFKGSDAPIGRKFLKLIASGIKYSSNDSIRIVPLDVSSMESTLESIEKIKEKDLKIILGPIFSNTVESMSSAYNGRIFLTLSNNPSVANESVYIFGHAPMKQNERMIQYALKSNYKDFIFLLPESSYSKNVTDVLSAEITDKGGYVVDKIFYNIDDESKMEKITTALVEKVSEIHNKKERKPFILIGDDEVSLKKIYDIIRKNDLDQKALIGGDSRLNIPYEHSIDYMFVGSDNFIDSELSKNLAKITNKDIIAPMEALSFDLGLLIGNVLNTDSEINVDEIKTKLEQKNGYLLGGGFLKFVDNIAIRSYDILYKKNDIIKIEDRQ
jgi:hypothetical protein